MPVRTNQIGPPEVIRVAQKILEYIEQNPNAMDTLEGVAQWWIREDVRRVRTALSLLLRRKIVQAKVLNEHDYYLLCERYRGDTLFSELHLIGQRKANASRNRGSKKR